MANLYKTVVDDVSTTIDRTLYTTPLGTTAIFNSILVCNDNVADDDMTISIRVSNTPHPMFFGKSFSAGTTTQLLTTPLVVESGDAIILNAQTGGRLHVVASILEVT
jgi:hypothetical protein|tara:strand:+ start:2292 stop:2612 length:321 start_codon:yes stop_codon:yes gene_type:complete